MSTINKRETSYQGLAERFENGEDGIAPLMYEDRNAILSPKVSITAQDLAEIPLLAQLRAAILSVEEQARKASGRNKYLLKKSAIEMRQDQYLIKNAYRRPISFPNISHDYFSIPFDETVFLHPLTKEPISTARITLFNPRHISALLNNYAALRKQTWGQFSNDMYYLLEDLDHLIETTLPVRYPYYYELLLLKVNGMKEAAIRKCLIEDYNITYTTQYISSLWTKKIPNLLAESAKEQYLIWYYTYCERGKWKKCKYCGQVKLLHGRFFSRNGSSRDGYYSMCKECRNARARERRKKKSKKIVDTFN